MTQIFSRMIGIHYNLLDRCLKKHVSNDFIQSNVILLVYSQIHADNHSINDEFGVYTIISNEALLYGTYHR